MISVVEQLKEVHFGVVYHKDKSNVPHRYKIYLGYPRSEDELEYQSKLSYDNINSLIQDGLVEEKDYLNFSYLVLTYYGKKKMLESTGWTFNGWWDKHYACCEKAIPIGCVCRVSIECPDHGRKCVGTHD